MRFILIPADDNQPVTDFGTASYPSTYDAISKRVGGFIEAVYFPFNDSLAPSCVLYLNEEGKLDNLPYNERATLLTRAMLSASDLIVGDVVITGPTDDDGETTSVDQATFDRIMEWSQA